MCNNNKLFLLLFLNILYGSPDRCVRTSFTLKWLIREGTVLCADLYVCQRNKQRGRSCTFWAAGGARAGALMLFNPLRYKGHVCPTQIKTVLALLSLQWGFARKRPGLKCTDGSHPVVRMASLLLVMRISGGLRQNRGVGVRDQNWIDLNQLANKAACWGTFCKAELPNPAPLKKKK